VENKRIRVFLQTENLFEYQRPKDLPNKARKYLGKLLGLVVNVKDSQSELWFT
jgi:hypothetical protein